MLRRLRLFEYNFVAILSFSRLRAPSGLHLFPGLRMYVLHIGPISIIIPENAEGSSIVIPENAKGVYPESRISLKIKTLGVINPGFPLSRE